MEIMYLKKIKEIRKNKEELEDKLNVRINISGNEVTFRGSSLEEYEAKSIFDAINLGFSVKKALLLKGEDVVFKVIHIKSYTRRDLKTIKSRLIGKKGKTRRTISQISGCEILIGESEVGLIGEAEDVGNVENAIINLIKGSKQANVYKYLEKINRKKRNSDFMALFR